MNKLQSLLVEFYQEFFEVEEVEYISAKAKFADEMNILRDYEKQINDLIRGKNE
jgi:hypothetical protein